MSIDDIQFMKTLMNILWNPSMAYCFRPGIPQQYVLHGLWMGADIAGLSKSIAGGVSPVANPFKFDSKISDFLMSLWFGRRYCKSM